MTEIKSRVKLGILKLNNLKSDNSKDKLNKKFQGIKYQIEENQPLQQQHQPSQSPQRNNKSMKLLSDAELNVQAFISNILVTIDPDDHDIHQVQSKLKHIKQQNKRTSLKLVDTSDEEEDDDVNKDCYWGKSKTRIPSKKQNHKQSNYNLLRKATNINGFSSVSSKNKPGKDAGLSFKVPSINAIRMGTTGIEYREKSMSSTLYLKNNHSSDSCDNDNDIVDNIGVKGDMSPLSTENKLFLNQAAHNNSHSCTNSNSKDILFCQSKTFKKDSKNALGKKALTQSNRKGSSEKKYTRDVLNTSPHKKPSEVLLEKQPNSDRQKKSVIIDDKDNVDETDIRNILPMDNQKFNDYSGICSKLSSCICLQPKKETSIKASSKSLIHKQSFSPKFDEDDTEEENDEEHIKKREMRYRKITHTPQVYDSNSDEESDDEITEMYYLAPTSPTRIIYDCILIIMIVYSSFSVPFSLAFELNKIRTVSFDFIINVFIDCFFACDIFLSFFTAFFDFDEDLVKDFSSIAINYLSKWFWIDILSCFPYYSLIEFYCMYNPRSTLAVSTKNIFNSASLTLVNLTKLFRLIKAFKIFHSNAFINYVKQILVEQNMVSKWFRLWMTLVLFLFSCHLLACVWIFFGFNYYPNWIVDQDLDPKDQGDIYTASLYFIFLTIYSVGYGDITSISIPERAFNLFLLIVGIIIYSWTVSSLSRYYVDGDEKTLEFRRKYDLLQDIKMTYENMPMELFEKIQRFLLYQKNSDRIDSNDILDDLPIGLRNNLITEMYKPIIENFIFFKNFDSNDFKIKVILCLKPLIGLKNERLVNDGDLIEEIFFVKTGRLVLEFPLPIVLSPELAKVLDKNSMSINPAGTIQEQLNLAITKGNNYTLDDFDLGKQKEARLNTLNNPNANSSLPQIHQQYVKIIDICRNEHFGDVLMFLNQRSPLRVKVKSQRAELFILKRSDAIEISSSYEKIWQKIIKKSLFNMQQINRLINRSLKYFFRYYEGKDKARLTNEGDTLTKGAKNSYFKHTGTINNILNIKDDELHSIPSEHRSLKEEGRLAPINEVESRKESTSQLGGFAKLIPCAQDDHSDISTNRRKSFISDLNSSTRTLTANICNHNVNINKKPSGNMMPNDIHSVNKRNAKHENSNNANRNAPIAADNSSILFYKEDDINSEYYPNEADFKENIFYCREVDKMDNSLFTMQINEQLKTITNRNFDLGNGDDNDKSKKCNNNNNHNAQVYDHDHKHTDSIIFNHNDRNIYQHIPLAKDESPNSNSQRNSQKNHEDSEVFMSKLRVATQINPLFSSVKTKGKISAQMSDKTLKILNHKFSTQTISKCQDIHFSLDPKKEDESDNDSIDKLQLQSQVSNCKRFNRRSLDERTIETNKPIGTQIPQQRESHTTKFGATVMNPVFSPAILGEPIDLKPRRQSVVIGLQKKDSLFTTSMTGNPINNLRKENKEKKLNIISTNIKDNALIMKYPDTFYNFFFSNCMIKEKGSKFLNKKLNNIMKLIENQENEERQKDAQ